MKALVQTEHGANKIKLQQRPVPEVGADDILLEVKAAGLCGSDLSFLEGRMGAILRPPVTLGHEFAGVVAKVGRNVTRFRVGDRVVSDNTGHVCGECYACATANYLACKERLGLGYGMDGGFAKYCLIPGRTLQVFPGSLMSIPEGISFEEAAILDPACNGYRAVVQEAGILPGEMLAVFGVGALGQFSIQAARAAGASKIFAIGLLGDEERMQTAKLHGATDILYADKQDIEQEIAARTSGAGLAAIIDCAGPNQVTHQAASLLRLGGTLVKVGYDPSPPNFSLDVLVDRSIQFKGHFGYDWVCWNNVMNLVLAGKMSLKTMITHRMKLSEFEQAFALLKNKEALKVVLYPED